MCVVFYFFRVLVFTVLDQHNTDDFKCSMHQEKKKSMSPCDKTFKMDCLMSFLVCFLPLVCSRSHGRQQ